MEFKSDECENSSATDFRIEEQSQKAIPGPGATMNVVQG